jgi:hypothetical protein
VQYVTAGNLGKRDLEKTLYGELALAPVERAGSREIRVGHRPPLQERIAESAFMRKRTAVQRTRRCSGAADSALPTAPPRCAILRAPAA